MSDEGKRREMTAAAALLDDDDLLDEILLRLSPLPSSLPRASVVSKRWQRIATAPAFHRRFLAHHRKKPSILGVFQKLGPELVFSSVLGPPNRIPRERFTLRVRDTFLSWTLLGCRDGRVLIISSNEDMLLVFVPISGDRNIVAVPQDFVNRPCTVSGAVLCAAGDRHDHVHGDCPFKVVLVRTRSHGKPAIAQMYSSETGSWGNRVSTLEPCAGTFNRYPCTLIGDALYWSLNESQLDVMLEFDLGTQRLSLVKRPTFADIRRTRIIRAEGGGVGISVLSYPSFQIWGQKVTSNGGVTWVLQRTVNMHQIIGLPFGITTRNEFIVGYSEDAHAVLISVSCNEKHYDFIVELGSMQSRQLNRIFLEYPYHPFTNFYTPGTVRV